MDTAGLRAQIKALIVSALNLEGKDPSSIEDETPLFSNISLVVAFDKVATIG